MSTEEEVRAASRQFYAALNRMANGDASAMAEIWSHSAAATALHPIGGRHVGWDAIKESFAKVGSMAADGKIELKDQVLHVAGDVATESGIEHGSFKLAGHPVALEHRVTNIYQLEKGAWKMTHHHTDISPGMIEVLAKL